MEKKDLSVVELHVRTHRPWGWYEVVDRGERFLVKRIAVNPSQKLSLQMHHHREEHWVVVRGEALVTNGDKKFTLAENGSTFIPQGAVHRLENPGDGQVEVVEIQYGTDLREDDIVRFDDVYGR